MRDNIINFAVVVAFFCLFAGWLYNIAMLFTANEDVGMVMFRILGTLFAPIGALTGLAGLIF